MEDMPDQEGHKHGQESYCQITQHRLFNRCFSKLGTDITSQEQGKGNHDHCYSCLLYTSRCV